MINEEQDDREPYTETDPILSLPVVEEVINLAEEKGHSVGTKSLNTFYSIVFIINQIYGPGVLAIPAVFQQAGFFLTTIVLAIFALVSCFSASLLCEALSLIPGNKRFDKHIEYTGAVKHYFGHRWYMLFQLLMNLCMQSYNIASIIICARSLDQFMTDVMGKTFAVEIIPHPQLLTVTSTTFLYNSTPIYISLGYLIVTLFCLPAGFLNLEDNVKVVQLGSFVVLIILMGEFCGQFIKMGVHFSHVPAIGKDFSQLVSIFIFSWAYVMFIPSWVNEKKNEVSVNKVIWICGIASFFGYLCIGLLAALAVPKNGSDDLLVNLGSNSYSVITIIASYIFSLGVIAPGIPVCCITTRYNLYIGKVCGKKMSYFWGVIAPWLVAFIFSQATYFAGFINWSSLIVNGVVNFLVPLLLYLKAISVQPVALNGIEKGDHEYSTAYIGGLTGAPSTVEPWPRFMRQNANYWTMVFFVITAILVVTQVVYAVYLIAHGKSAFG